MRLGKRDQLHAGWGKNKLVWVTELLSIIALNLLCRINKRFLPFSELLKVVGGGYWWVVLVAQLAHICFPSCIIMHFLLSCLIFWMAMNKCCIKSYGLVFCCFDDGVDSVLAHCDYNYFYFHYSKWHRRLFKVFWIWIQYVSANWWL